MSGSHVRCGLGLGLIALLLALLPTGAAAEVLRNQIDATPPGSSPSQDFEPADNSHDSLGADDFQVPAGEAWQADRIFVTGQTFSSVLDPLSARVYLFATSGSLPGAQLHSQAAAPDPGTVYPDYDLPLAGFPVLPPGRWWIGVQARRDNSQGIWNWFSNSTQSGFPAVWRNPGGGFGFGCTTFTARTSCIPASPGPDHSYRLEGNRAPVELQVKKAKAKRNGKLKLTVNAPNVGELTARSKQLKRAKLDVSDIGEVGLRLKPKRTTLNALEEGQRVKAKVKLSLPPFVNGTKLGALVKKRLKP